MKCWIFRLALWLTRPSRDALVRHLVASIAGLELMKGEDRRLAPIKGSTYGAFSITGNSNPEIRYITFDDKLMEFVHMTVALNLPDRITFTAVTEDLGEIYPKPAYQKPFYTMAAHTYCYFPLIAEGKGAAVHVI